MYIDSAAAELLGIVASDSVRGWSSSEVVYYGTDYGAADGA